MKITVTTDASSGVRLDSLPSGTVFRFDERGVYFLATSEYQDFIRQRVCVRLDNGQHFAFDAKALCFTVKADLQIAEVWA